MKLRSEELQRRRNLLDEWEGVKATQFRELVGAAKRVNKRLKGYVRVEVSPAGDLTPLTALLRDEVGGRLDVAIRQLESADELSLTDLVARCRSGAAELAEHYSITGTDVLLSVFDDRIEVQSPGSLPNTISVEGMREGARYARNQVMMSIMRDYGYVEGLGMGIRRQVIPAMAQHNGTEPDFSEEESRFTVSLRK